MNGTKKIIFYVFCIVLVISIIWIVTTFLKSKISYDGEITAAVDSEIIIERDKLGTPRVKAKTTKDAYFSIGFLHGKDRLSLIEYYRAIAHGRLSELVGEEGLLIDKISRSMNFVSRAYLIVNKLKGPYSDYLEAYVSGVNESKNNYYDIFSSFSNITSTDWSKEDIISILLLFEWADSYLNNKELLFPIPYNLDSRLQEDIIPKDLHYNYSIEEARDIEKLRKIGRAVKDYIGAYKKGLAFYIDGRRMKDGISAVGFNIDCSMSIYPKWYPLYIEVDSIKLTCITASGLPFIFSGSNNDISFTEFNLSMDTQDFCVLKTRRRKEKTQYLSRNRWKDFKITEETIYTDTDRIEKNSYKTSMRYSEEGPVLNDIFEDAGENLFTVKYLIPDDRYVISLFKIPFSNSIYSAQKHLKNLMTNPKVYLFASEKKAITAYTGKVPERNIRKKILKKWNRNLWPRLHDLSGYKRRAINNQIIGNQYFDLPKRLKVYTVYSDINRLKRLKKLIENEKLNEMKEVMQVLLDTYSPVAEKYLPLFISILEEISITSSRLSRIYFNEWDLHIDADSISATIFNTVLINMLGDTIGDEFSDYRDEILENYPMLVNKFYKTIDDGTSFLFDDIRTKLAIESRDEIFKRAFLKSLRYMNEYYGPIMDDWKWGKLHIGHYGFPLLDQGIFNDERSDELMNVAIPGGNSTICKGAFNEKNNIDNYIVTSLSGILSSNLLHISPRFSCPIDPESIYYQNYYVNNKFTCLNKEKGVHKFIIKKQTGGSDN